MAKKRIAHKIELWVDHDKDLTFTKVAAIKSIGTPGKSREVVDMTCLDSEIEDGEPSPVLVLGDMTASIFWDEADTDHQMLETLAESQDKDTPWQIRFLFAATITKSFTGWVKDLPGASYEVKSEVMRDLTVHVTSKPVNT